MASSSSYIHTPQSAQSVFSWLEEMGAHDIVSELSCEEFNARLEEVKPKETAPNKQKLVAPSSTIQPVTKQRRAQTQIPPSPLTPTNTSPKELAESCNTIDEIENILSSYQICPLQRTATNLCYCDGNKDAKIMLIGEAPGRDEDLQGKPFVGRSGQLLDKIIAAIGLSRTSEDIEKSVFITNALFWRPPGNRKPTEAELLLCAPFLNKTIELIAPHVIVCLGATPAQQLTGSSEGILRMRGRWRDITIGTKKIPLLPTLHPAYLLRQPAQKQLAWRDFLCIADILHNG